MKLIHFTVSVKSVSFYHFKLPKYFYTWLSKTFSKPTSKNGEKICVAKKFLCLINNETEALCCSFRISFVSDRCDKNLDLDILFLKIEQISTEVKDLEDQNAVSYETSELFHFSCYMSEHVRVEGFIHMLK